MTSTTTWDPALYLDFDDLRSRPFADLLARVGARDPRHVVDAGCGPGHLTTLLSSRWPGARVSAFDSSPAMVAAARERGIEAATADVETWVPDDDVDVIVTNAVLQWVPGHRDLLRRWVEALPDGGWIAMQVPGNFTAPSHELARDAADRFGVPLRDAATVAEPADYADDLTAAGAAAVDVWETTYLQRLTGEDPVLHWISGTALRPVRDALSDEAYATFTTDLAPRLREAYPQAADGSTWFPFRRIFAVARVETRS
ncbi:trans-aconitate 2-methyltransferase [Actinomycetospora sp. TBRC 11914]|uniref:trans-aconitate 2-methyltransferase n=1 Tax=Actinomycetospora sp. TBRC 11914 TaxID=2729387 RepID=UPI00145E7178|nr:trans-aconitate 2-methyltransferase [Actinomycetospora sp. TBRC 11914]NMO89910.1 trans-aconitate 2-methyltransferase [Actinomycetospora sp. TBRC 11914]